MFISETSFNEIHKRALEGIDFAYIQNLIEDLNEAGMEIHMSVSGYEISIIKAGKVVCFAGNLDVVAKYLRELNAGLIAEHGEMGGE